MSALLAVPNFSEGRDQEKLGAIASALGGHGAELLDVHRDPDHNRSVYTLAGSPGELAPAVAAGAREALVRLDINSYDGLHPHVGVLDVAPIVYLEGADRGAACAEALVLGDLLGGDLGIPVLIYGELADGRPRSELRRGGPEQLAARIANGELTPDFGPTRAHPTAGVTLLSARPPLIAFNLELAPPATEQDAKRIAAAIRESPPSGTGLAGVRAIGLWLAHRDRAQVSANVEDYRATPLATLIEAVRREAPIERAELVGLAPRAALENFPADIELANRRVIEDLLTFGEQH